MSIGPLTNLASSYLQSILGTTSSSSTKNANSSTALSSIFEGSDNSQLSPFAQLMSTLQQLQQSNPTQYAQVTQQIATNLQSAAQTAQSQGNTAAASQLTQLSNDFTAASKSGQLPNIQDLAQAIGGHHHHGHHAHGAAADSSSSSSTDSSSTSSSSSADQTLSQLLSAFQTSSAQSDALNPMGIILNTLASAGIGGSNGS